MEQALSRVAEVEAKIAAHDAATVPSTVDPASFAMLAADLKSIWTDPTTDARLKKRIVRTVIHEVIADIRDRSAHPLGWRGPHRDTPAHAAAWATHQHLGRCDCRRTQTGADLAFGSPERAGYTLRPVAEKFRAHLRRCGASACQRRDALLAKFDGEFASNRPTQVRARFATGGKSRFAPEADLPSAR